MTKKLLKRDDVISYREMCDIENVQTLQRGMNYRLNPSYSVVLMSQRTNAPYKDKIYEDGLTIEYEGHDVSKQSYEHNPKYDDQVDQHPTGKPTQNGLFVRAVKEFKSGLHNPELVRVYEKILPGVWSLKGVFELHDFHVIHDGNRHVFRFVMALAKDQKINIELGDRPLEQNRVIPSEVKKIVWSRDKGQCVLCGSKINLHFDHDLPFSKGGTSYSEKNVRLLCMKHNLEKSSKIE